MAASDRVVTIALTAHMAITAFVTLAIARLIVAADHTVIRSFQRLKLFATFV